MPKISKAETAVAMENEILTSRHALITRFRRSE